MSESGSESHVVSAAKSRLLLQSFVSVLSLNLLLSIYLLLSLINIYFQLFNSKSKRMNNALIFFFFLSSLNFLNRIPNMALAVTLRVSAHLEYRASQEARDPRDQLVQRDHPGITDPKDLWVHEESKAMKDPVENRDFLAQMEVQGQLVPWGQGDLDFQGGLHHPCFRLGLLDQLTPYLHLGQEVPVFHGVLHRL